MKTLENLTSTPLSDTGNIVIAPKNQERFIYLPFNKKDKYFSNPNDLYKFIKDVELVIRTSKEYSAYIKYLKETVGLKQCSLYSEIDDSKAPIEMHHGPIFTLYDIVEIQIAYLFKNGSPINSFKLANNVLKDHWNNVIQVVMLCRAAHIAVHNDRSRNNKNRGQYFIPPERTWGNINEFIKKYYMALSITHYEKIKRYISDYKNYVNNSDKQNENELFINKITKWVDVLKEKNMS
jgi:hypothetical protein